VVLAVVVAIAVVILEVAQEAATLRGHRTTTTTTTTVAMGKRLIYQVCEKKGHIVVQCWYMFDESCGSEKKIAATATHVVTPMGWT
jgi:hypothetical protein